MKTLDLNIDLGKIKLEEGKTVSDIATDWLLTAVYRGVNKSDKSGMATITSDMELQRKMARIMHIFDEPKDEVEIEDSDFEFIKKNFEQAQFPVSPASAIILCELEKKLDEAK